MPAVEIRLLGPLEVDVDGRPVELRRRKQRALLALLALRAGAVVSTDRLVDELWGETPPKAAVGSLQNLVSGLRKVLTPDVLITRPPGYVLEVERDAVDVHRFERLVEEASQAVAPQERVRLLRGALSLWRGSALADFPLEGLAGVEASRLEEVRTSAREDRLDAELGLGRQSQAIAELEQLVAKHPLRERPKGLLMRALYQAGRQADALEAYRDAREVLVDEIGIDPSPELRRLEQAILRQDPELDPTPSAPQPSTPASRKPERRKTVTILFIDVVDSAGLGADLDPEVLRDVMRRYFQAAQTVIERHGGTVEKFIGDAVMAAFGIPSVHEDDAVRAVRAASEIRDALGELNADLRKERGILLQLRMGLNTGEVLAADPSSGQSFATGNAVNVAVRLEEAAIPGEILLGEPTYRLVRHAVEVEPVGAVDLGGALGRLAAFRLLGVGDVARPLGGAQLVGRREELAWLQAAVAGVQAERRSRVVTVLGDAGVGKTRLASELLSTLGATGRALVGRCASYGQGATYLPLAEIVGQAVPKRPQQKIASLLAGDEHAELIAQRVTQLAGETDGVASTGEIFWAVRRFFEALASDRTLVVVLEDVHWAEPTLLDLVEYLDAWIAEVPLLVVCLARPELLEERPGWDSSRGVLSLQPLGTEDAETLLRQLAVGEIADTARDRIVEVAEGNPLFMEQLLAFAQEAGADKLTTVPPSVEAILAARLERLDAEERALLGRVAVAGRQCSWNAVIHLSPPDELAGVDGRLMNLVRRGLLSAARTEGEDSFRFHHILIRDVVYTGMTKEARADLHDRYAVWLEQRGGTAEEILGYHLERAFLYRRELGSVGGEAFANARRAAALLASAGRRAPARGDWPAAAALLSRSVLLLPEGDEERLRLLPDLARALGRCGDYAGEIAMLDEAIMRAEAAGDRRTRSYALLFKGHARMHVEPGFTVEEEVRAVEQALGIFEELGDEYGRARAWARLAYYKWFSGHHAEARGAEERALAYAVAAGNEPLEAEARGFIGSTLLNGPARLDELVSYAEELVDQADTRGRDSPMRPLLGLLGVAHAMGGEFETARELVAEEVAAFEDVGNEHAAVRAAAHGFGAIELLAGDPAAAEQYLTQGFQALEDVGETGHLSSVAGLLADAIYVQGRYEEAVRYTRIGEETAARDDYLSQILWRSTRAKAFARQGRLSEGERLAHEAVVLAHGTDDLNSTGNAFMALAEVLQIEERIDEAASATEEALRLYEEKGNLVAAGRAQSLISELQSNLRL